MKLRYIIATVCLFSLSVYGQTENNDSIQVQRKGIKDYTKGIIQSALAGVEYRIKAGIAIGGTTPLPIPLEIQEIKGFSPLLNISLEAEIAKTFNETWGLNFGLRLETKGMETNAQVKGYQIKYRNGDSEISGPWTGMVSTRISTSYITLPVLAVWKPSKRWDIKLGPYVSYLYNGNFSGYAYDGYLREGSPVGEKMEIEKTPPYDFSDDLRHWNWGMQFGANWRAFSHLLVGLDLTWGLNSIFKSDFDVFSFSMYPVYLNLNFGYAF